MARKRIIYQSEALFAGATGDTAAVDISQIHRVQSVSHNVDVTRTDVNEFGRLAALSREVIEVPTVGCEFSYFVVDGKNEASGLGLTVRGINSPDSAAAVSALSGIMAQDSTEAEKNYYILTVPEGEDANGTAAAGAGNGVIGIGNGFITSYGVEASVGEIPTASVNVEASNLRFDINGASAFANPAIDTSDGTPKIGAVTLPVSSTGELTAFVMRPGDITVDFGTALLQEGGAYLPGMTIPDGSGASCVQSVSLDVPLGRTPLQCLGNVFPKSRELDFPINCSLSVSANLADIASGTLRDVLCNDAVKRNISVLMKNRCGGSDSFRYELKNATLDSQNMSMAIGDSKTVELSFSAQIGGASDSENGIFLSGVGY